MTQADELLQRGQERAMPKEDLTPYAGQWVALRNGYVIAADLDPIALRERHDVQDGDALIPVPPSTGAVMQIL